MRLNRIATVACGLIVLASTLPAAAQRPTSGFDRLFLSFVEDATIPEDQWWEGQLEYVDADGIDATILRGIFAIAWRDRVEFGARVGVGDTSADSPLIDDGFGATDMDIWGKYYFGSQGGVNEFAAGALFTIPVGDDSAGLGFDSFGATLFGAYRRRMERMIVTGNIGVRINDDGRVVGVELDGEIAPIIAGGVIVPINNQIGFVGEARLEGERFDGADEDIRFLGGANIRVGSRGQFRPALAFGVTDGAPDLQVLAGYSHQF